MRRKKPKKLVTRVRRRKPRPAATRAPPKPLPEVDDIPKSSWSYEDAKRLYNSKEYKEWRTYVYQRDEYTCQMCGAQGGAMEVHHVRPKYSHPHLVLDPHNGVALCKTPCHQKLVTKSEGYFIHIFDRIVKLNTRRYKARKLGS